ncbi:MAG: hypothetical protein JJU42_01700 [Rhodobacteraceae bacterium]|nr:hypothetical protein [Paracoccaceae bacterium]
MRIAIIGLGMVALADALVLARRHSVTMTGPVPDRVEAVNAGQFPLPDPGLNAHVAANALNIRATLDTRAALEGAQMVLISVPLRLDPARGTCDTTELETRIALAHRMCPAAPIVIRSAVPIGFTDRMRRALCTDSILCVPEFLREGAALADALAPRFLIVGERGPLGTMVGALFQQATDTPDLPLRLMGPSEAEAVKHFSQTWLAARVAYFNELDSYALSHGLNARQVIDGVCLDPRIGTYANNPCFGYGGNRLPRSTGHLCEVFGTVPAHVVPKLPAAGGARIALLASKVLERGARRIGIYHPEGEAMALNPLAELRDRLAQAGADVLVCDGARLDTLKSDCDLVIAQRMTPELRDIGDKVFSRDLYALN